MKIRKGFVLREMCGETLVTAEGMDNFDFDKVISLNATAAYLWKTVEGKDFDESMLTSLLLDRYEVDNETASKDAAGRTGGSTPCSPNSRPDCDVRASRAYC